MQNRPVYKYYKPPLKLAIIGNIPGTSNKQKILSGRICGPALQLEGGRSYKIFNSNNYQTSLIFIFHISQLISYMPLNCVKKPMMKKVNTMLYFIMSFIVFFLYNTAQKQCLHTHSSVASFSAVSMALVHLWHLPDT